MNNADILLLDLLAAARRLRDKWELDGLCPSDEEYVNNVCDIVDRIDNELDGTK